MKRTTSYGLVLTAHGTAAAGMKGSVRHSVPELVLWAWLTVAMPIATPKVSLAAPPHFESAITRFGLADVGQLAAPVFVDIDGDGDLDAFIGAPYGTFFFQNTGTTLSPAFASPSINPFGLDTHYRWVAPTFADVDGDGDFDAFVGGTFRSAYFFENTGTAQSPAFKSPSTNPFGLTDVGWNAHPAFADIDGDGDLDAFVGEYSGSTFFFKNKGTALKPAFATPSPNPFGLADVGLFAAPTFADVDGDGDPDAFVGEVYGATLFFKNKGTAQNPVFAAASANPSGLGNVGSAAVPTFADIDGDGDLDAFVGGADGWTFFSRNTGTAQSRAFAGVPFVLGNVGQSSKPTFVDIDGDRDADAFLGVSLGSMFFFRNTGTAQRPAAAAASANPFGLANVGYAAAPAFADIDGDGDLDAFVGEDDGSTSFFKNKGTTTKPNFPAFSTNPFGLANVGGDAAPAFADIDGDGDLDAFVGDSWGGTSFFRNTGTAHSPAFTPSFEIPLQASDLDQYAAPTFADIDGDGDLDAFVGGGDGSTFFFENTGSPQSPAFSGASANWFGLVDVGAGAAPAFVDIDGDGDLDAFVGERFGATFFFENTAVTKIFADGFESGSLQFWSGHVP